MRIVLEISELNEGTESPWWFIVRPQSRGFLTDPEAIAHCITGPFFSREEAEHELNSRRYDYGHKAIVWCGSGYRSSQYKNALRQRKPKLNLLARIARLWGSTHDR